MKLYCELGIIVLLQLFFSFVLVKVIFLVLNCEKYYSVFLTLEIRVELLLLPTHYPSFNVDQTDVYLLEVRGDDNYKTKHHTNFNLLYGRNWFYKLVAF